MNGLKRGSKTATSQTLDASVGYLETLRKVAPYWRARRKGRSKGFGLCSMFYGIGNTAISNPSNGQLSLKEGGKIGLHMEMRSFLEREGFCRGRNLEDICHAYRDKRYARVKASSIHRQRLLTRRRHRKTSMRRMPLQRT